MEPVTHRLCRKVEGCHARGLCYRHAKSKEKCEERAEKLQLRRNNKHSRGTYLSDPDSSSEEEYPLWTRAKRANLPLSVRAEEFHPKRETPKHVTKETVVPEESLEEENIEKGQNIEREIEAPIIESEDEQSEAGTINNRPKRVIQPRRVYTYDQLGVPTFQQLKICPVGVKWSTGTSHDLSAGSSFMYPFYHC